MEIAKLDKNFVQTSSDTLCWDDYLPEALTLEGFPWWSENEATYCRLPKRILPDVGPGLQGLSFCNAGGVIRFVTDSAELKISGNYYPFGMMPHMPLTGQAGFDVMVHEGGKDRFLSNLHGEPQDFQEQNFSFSYSCPLTGALREYRIYMPLYAGVEKLVVSLNQGARVEQAPPRKVMKPILIYGSSITQGGCASRPSNCHGALLSSWLDAECINMGFSGNAKGERILAEEFAELDLSCFLMDYDFNADTVEDLMETHEPFFEILRKKNPDLPVVFISRPLGNSEVVAEAQKRRSVILRTYENAQNAGDEKVFFVDGMSVFEQVEREAPTVDRVHPTDFGFYLMAQGILPTLRRALKL